MNNELKNQLEQLDYDAKAKKPALKRVFLTKMEKYIYGALVSLGAFGYLADLATPIACLCACVSLLIFVYNAYYVYRYYKVMKDFHL